MWTKNILILVLLFVGAFNLSLKNHWLTNRQSHQDILQFGSSYSLTTMDRRMLVNGFITGQSKQNISDWKSPLINTSNPQPGSQKPSVIQVLGDDKASDRVVITVYENDPNNKFMVVAFRYSQTYIDFLTDINLKATKYEGCDGCWVHEGFYKSWTSMKTGVLSNISSISNQYNIKNLYITGVSLGAGLAQISLIHIANNRSFENIKVVTFAGPRVGNQAWTNEYQKKVKSTANTLRFVLPNDPIAVQPYQTIYKQKVIFIHSGENIVCSVQNQSCINFGNNDRGQHLTSFQKIQGMRQILRIVSYASKNGGAYQFCKNDNPFPHYNQKFQPLQKEKPYDFNIHMCDYSLLIDWK